MLSAVNQFANFLQTIDMHYRKFAMKDM